MPLRLPNITSGSFNILYTTTQSLPASSTSSTNTSKSTRPPACLRWPRRAYATIAGDSEEHRQDNAEQEQHQWPAAPNGQAHPTPYQIFSMKHNASYSKIRFYELVKLYHPDRINGSYSEMPRDLKMERYRLIVAAHNILSDPLKRTAYDRFGAGWNGRAEVGEQNQATGNGKAGPFSPNWSQPGDPIWQNATWEDWEKFYAKRAREQGGGTAAGVDREQSPYYMPHSQFILLVAFLALIGSTANYTRMENAGSYFVAQRDLVHDRSAKDLRRVRQEAAGGSRDERIQWFLRNREATLGMAGSDVEVLREEKLDRVLPEREVCRSDEVTGKDA